MNLHLPFKLILSVALISGLVSGVMGQLPVYTSKFTLGQIVIDGALNEPDWMAANEVTLKKNQTDTVTSDVFICTRVKSCYDKQNMYISFVCNDPDVWGNFNHRDDYLWKEEVVEVFIDTDDNPNDYIELEVSPAGILFDSFIVNPIKIDFAETAKFDIPHLKVAVTRIGTFNVRDDTDQGWIVEMALPFSEMPGLKDVKDLIGKKWRVNFYRVNRDKGKATGLYSWSPTLGRFHTPSKFGIYCLE